MVAKPLKQWGIIMFKRLFSVLILVIVSCSLFGDTASYNIYWDSPVENDIVKMHLYKWEGKDTTQCPFFDGMALDPQSDANYYGWVEPYSTQDQFVATADGDSTYISLVAQYEDDQGNLSSGTWSVNRDKPWSHFIISKDARVEDPQNVQHGH